MALNFAVFIAWQLLGDDPMGGPFMINNFLVSWDGFSAGYVWTVFTSVFSHISLMHFLLNMFVLNNFGPLLEQLLGARRFIGFYLVAGLVSSCAHSLVSAFILGKPELPALGASGAISGLVMVFSLLFPRQKLLLLGVIPVPALIGAFVFVGLDIWGLLMQAEGGGLPIGHGAHLGGALCGLLYYFFYLRARWVRSY
jgi:membrane associated rhomboid family serine protease